MRDSERAQCAGAVVPVVQQHPIVGANDVKKVRAEPHYHTHDAGHGSERSVVPDLLGAKQGVAVKAKVGGLRTKDVAPQAGLPDLYRVQPFADGQAEPE